jgi:anti-anti-sigma regulatory factor
VAISGPVVSRTHADDALVVSFAGGGLAAATELHGELEDAVGSGERRVVVDLARAVPLDLTVFGVLLAGMRRLGEAHGRLVLLAPPAGAPLYSGEELPLERYFRVEHSLRAAIAATAEGLGR